MKQEVVEYLQREAYSVLVAGDSYQEGRTALAREILEQMEIPYEMEEDSDRGKYS